MNINKQRKKLLLVSPHWGLNPPLGIGYIASYLETHLPEISVDISVVKPGPSAVKEILKKSPDLVGFGFMIPDYKYVRSWAETIKSEMGIPIIIGGQYITPVPHTLDQVFDIAVLYEGEATALELFRKYIENDGFHSDILKNIKGIAFHDNGEVKINEFRPFIEPMDSIPPPARHLLDMKRYTAPTSNLNANPFSKPMRIMMISTSRGCPYDCMYCQASKVWKNKYRMFSADYMAAEIEGLLKKYTFDTVLVTDDLFIVSKKRLQEFVEHIERNKWNKKLKFRMSVRANLFTEEVCKLLKRMNVYHVAFGFESNSPEVLKRIKKGSVTVEHNERSVRLAKKYGFEVEGAFLLGSPDETIEDINKTYEFVKSSSIDMFAVGIVVPLPGTELWDYAMEKGKAKLTTDISDFFPLNLSKYLVRLTEDGEQAYMTDKIPKDEFIKIVGKFASLLLVKGSGARIHLVDFFKPSNWKYIVSHPFNVLYLLTRQIYRNFVRTHPSAGAYLVRFKAFFSKK